MAPAWFTAQLVVSVVTIVVVVHLILVLAGGLTYFERKISAYIQDRIGPNRVDFFGIRNLGILQPLADGIKFMLKEDYGARNVDKYLFTLAPALIIIPALIAWAVIPWGGYLEVPSFTLPIIGEVAGGQVLVSAANVNVGVIYLLAVASLGVYGVVLGGWASNNKYSFLGGLRSSAGMISYEIPMGLAVLVVILMAGTVSPQGIVDHQVQHTWFVVAQPLAAILFYVCSLAEGNRAPFENSEAEQELVGGYHTEYSSMRLALFLLSEYAHMVTGSAFLVLLFFGGYHLPFVPLTDPASTGIFAVLVKFAVFVSKVVLVASFTMFVRWTLPRIRWDQVMKVAWNGLIPIGIALLILTSTLIFLRQDNTLGFLLMNLGLAIVIVAIQPLLPRENMNRRVPMAGSRFNPLIDDGHIAAGAPAPEGGAAKREPQPV